MPILHQKILIILIILIAHLVAITLIIRSFTSQKGNNKNKRGALRHNVIHFNRHTQNLTFMSKTEYDRRKNDGEI
jgi:flagellar basal body-associated protein FliL